MYFEHTTQVRVRYGETDQMGYVYYGRYAEFCEVGRVEAMRALGVTYKELEEDGIMMPVMSFTAKYIRPAFYDNLLTIKTQIRELPEESITFHSDIYNEDNKLINASVVKLCFIDIKEKKRVKVPQPIVDQLITYFEK